MNNNSITRRSFMKAGGAAAIWIPAAARGYTASEMKDFYSTGEMSIDVSKWELDTPALCVDLDLLEANLDKMAETMSKNGIIVGPMQRLTSARLSRTCKWTGDLSASALRRSVKLR
jgi:hypothetical protein